MKRILVVFDIRCMLMFHFSTFYRVYPIIHEGPFADLSYPFSKYWSKGILLTLLTVCLTVKSPSSKAEYTIGKAFGKAKQSS